ncbi:uncharacterized protein VTP21DRAFT_11630 [Calcarisporiella thermophila]|uniref:uncharacterized protein n=1 Tax=Calcarisporiella thermophila TaxID=911321 RepID=UPI003743A349
MNERFKTALEKMEHLLLCPVCGHILKETYTVTECGHVFCKACITDSIVDSASCPSCHLPMIPKNLRRNPQHDTLVECVNGLKYLIHTNRTAPEKHEEAGGEEEGEEREPRDDRETSALAGQLSRQASLMEYIDLDGGLVEGQDGIVVGSEVEKVRATPLEEEEIVRASDRTEACSLEPKELEGNLPSGVLSYYLGGHSLSKFKGRLSDVDMDESILETQFDRVGEGEATVELIKQESEAESLGANHSVPILYPESRAGSALTADSILSRPHTVIKEEAEELCIRETPPLVMANYPVTPVRYEREMIPDEDKAISHPLGEPGEETSYLTNHKAAKQLLDSPEDREHTQKRRAIEHPARILQNSAKDTPFVKPPRLHSGSKQSKSPPRKDPPRSATLYTDAFPSLATATELTNLRAPPLKHSKTATERKSARTWDASTSDHEEKLHKEVEVIEGSEGEGEEVGEEEEEEEQGLLRRKDKESVVLMVTGLKEGDKQQFTEALSRIHFTTLTVRVIETPVGDHTFNMDHVTHVVTSVTPEGLCPRTIKYLYALMAGKWVVSQRWVVDSVRAGRWLDEGPYEVRGDLACGEVAGPRLGRKSADHDETSPEEPEAGVKRETLRKRESGGRKLFHGCKFFFLGEFPDPLPGKLALQRLAVFGGATVLRRRPAPTSPHELRSSNAENEPVDSSRPIVLFDPKCSSVKGLSSGGLQAKPISWLLNCISRQTLL